MLKNPDAVNTFPGLLEACPPETVGIGATLMVSVFIETTGERLEFRRLNTVTQLLNKLKLKPGEVLVIRGRELLTPDRTIGHEGEIRVRHVVSRG